MLFKKNKKYHVRSTPSTSMHACIKKTDRSYPRKLVTAHILLAAGTLAFWTQRPSQTGSADKHGAPYNASHPSYSQTPEGPQLSPSPKKILRFVFCYFLGGYLLWSASKALIRFVHHQEESKLQKTFLSTSASSMLFPT